MSRVFADGVVETSTTTGTGTYTLAGARTGYQTFGSVMANNDTCYYRAEACDSLGNPSGGWEVGYGTWATGGTLARTRILASSNSGAAVSWAAGTKNVFLTRPAAMDNLPAITVIVGTGATQTGTVTVPEGCTQVEIEGVAAGGGGGEGRIGAAGTSRFGANGGNGGSYGKAVYNVSDLALSAGLLYYSVGAYGTGAASHGTTAANGNQGNDGTLTMVRKDSVGGATIFNILGGYGGQGGGSTATGQTANPAYAGLNIGGTGGQGSPTAAVQGGDAWGAAGGGGPGASINTSNTTINGLGGGSNYEMGLGGTSIANTPSGGAGGSGGTTAGVNGSAGANYGGGGGGGSANVTGSASGAGGNGGPALLRFRFF